MNEKKFGINWGGLKITSEEEPYVVLGEPLKSEEDAKKQAGYIALLVLTKKVLETCIDVLGFEAPDRM